MESGLKLWGVMTASALVLPNGAPTLVKAAARLAKVIFGARIQICDNVADEVEMNLAMGTGRRVILMDGGYTIAATATKAVVNVTLEGQGRGTIITLANNSDCHMITIGGDGWRIKDLYLDGNKANQSEDVYTGIYGNARENFRINDVEVYNTKHDGIRLYGCLHFRISGCYVHGCGYDPYTGNGIMATIGCYDFSITGCECNDNSESGIHVTEGYAGSITGCIARNNNYCNLQIASPDHPSYGIVVSGFVSDRQADASGVRVDGVKNCALTGIIHYGEGGTVADDGISITNSEWVSLSGFAVYFSGDNGLSIVADALPCKHISISNGTILNAGGQTALYSGVTVYSESANGLEDILIDNVTIEDDRGTKFCDYGIKIKTNSTGKADRVTISNCHITDVKTAGIFNEAGENIKAAINTIKGTPIGIHFDDGDDCMIVNNRIIDATTPIDINNAAVVRCQIQGNNWEGCTNDPSYGAATTPRFNYNIDKNGAWWSVSDGQPTARHFMLTARGGAPSTTDGCAGPALIEYPTNDVDMYHLDFQQAAPEYAQWGEIPLPDDYDGGTITAVFYWTGEAGAGTAIWALQGRAYAEGDPIDAAWGGAQTVTDTLTVAGDVHISAATAAITLAGSPAAGQLAQFRVYRNGGTKSEDARLIAVRVNYTGR